jgi:hypothetical protein
MLWRRSLIVENRSSPVRRAEGATAQQELRCIRHWPSQAARRWVEEFVRDVVRDERALALVAVGSAIRKVRASADLDLVLIHADKNVRYRSPRVDVDLRTYLAGEVDRKIGEGHDLLIWAVLFGKAVHEKASYWASLCDRWRGRLPLPSALEARKRAEKAQRILQELIAMGDEDAAREQLLTFLTHEARARLLEASIHPASRPELSTQLREIGEDRFADRLDDALYSKRPLEDILAALDAKGVRKNLLASAG